MRNLIQFYFILVLTSAVALAQDDWREFRGSDGTGHSTSRELPISWSETNNVKWKTAIHGRAWSSPVVLGKQVWLTTATEDGTQLFAICVDRSTGKIVHDLKLFEVEKPQFAHKFNTYGSPTPAIEPGRVYITFGSPGTACLDTKTGKVLWERRDLECNHYRGAGSSPIIHKNLLIMNFDGSDHQFVIALDKKTGKSVWEIKRSMDYKDLKPDGTVEAEGDFRKAFATPNIASINGVPTLLSQGAKAIYAYEPMTGKELWRVEERTSHSAGTRPLFGHGLVFAPSGWSSGQVMAIHPGTPGEVVDANMTTDPTGELKLAWKIKRAVPKKPSLLLVDELLYWIDDGGVATCVEAKTGTQVWQERVGGNHSASPLYAAGKIYFFNEDGKATVIESGREYKIVAESKLDEGFMATPAIAGNAIYLRTKTHLYRVEKK